jgi:hypothetical protein
MVFWWCLAGLWDAGGVIGAPLVVSREIVRPAIRFGVGSNRIRVMVGRKAVTTTGVRKQAIVKKRAPKDKAAGTRRTRSAGTKYPPVRRIEAVWLDGAVPNGYWDRVEHRRLYVRWLGQKLGFRKREDWYRITTGDFKRNSGGGLLNIHWNSSAIGAVKECFFADDWKDWLFGCTPRRFWRDPRNHRRYMKWLGQELGIRRPSDWYAVTNQDFKDHKGGAFLLHYGDTVSTAIMRYLPNYDWKEWMFSRTPKGFWRKRMNRRRYMIWLGKRLGFKHVRDWYSVTGDDFNANYGNQFLKLHNGLPVAAVRDSFPRHAWNEWMFARVPIGFWDEPENRKRYMRWLGRKLKFKRPQDWHKIRSHDFQANCGAGLLARYRSCFDLLKECIPEIVREEVSVGIV